jgi:hypothetical protein
MTIIRLVLPDPEGPTTATVSPAPISRLMPFRILTVPAWLASLRWMSARRSALALSSEDCGEIVDLFAFRLVSRGAVADGRRAVGGLRSR